MAADGSIVIEANLNDKQAQAELNRLTRKIQNINDQIEGKTRKRSYLAEQAAEIRAAYNEAIGLGQDERAQSLARQYDRVSAAMGRLDEQIRNHNTDVNIAQERAGQLAGRLADVGTTGADAGRRAASGMAKLEKRIVGLAKRVFIFSVITRALRSLRTWFMNTAKANDEAAAAIAQLKGALLTLAQPIVEHVIPVFIAFVNLLSRIVRAVASFMSMIFGTTLEQSASAAESLYNEQNAIAGVGDTAEDAKKQLAGFDEINKLATATASGGGGGKSTGTIAPDFSTDQLDKYKKLSDIIGAIGAGLAAWAVSDKVLGWFNNLAGGKFNNIGKIAAGVGLITTGLVLEIGNIKAIKSEEYENTSWKSVIGSTVSGLLTGLGLVAMGATGWAIPIAVTASIVVTDIVTNWESYKSILSHEVGAVKKMLEGDSEGFWEEASDGYLAWLKTDSWPQKLGKAVLGEDVWNDAIAYFDDGGSLEPIVTSMIDDIISWFQSLSEKVSTWLGNIWKKISEWFQGLPSKIGYKLGYINGKVKQWFDEELPKVINKITSFFQKLPERIYNAIIGVREKIRDWATVIINKMRTDVPLIINKIVGFFKDLPDRLKELGPDIWNGLVKGLTNAWNTVTTAISDFADSFLQGFKNAFGISSPSKEMETIGEYISEGLKNGIENGIGAIKGVINNIITFIETAVNWMIEKINSISFSVPDWIPVVGGSHVGFSIPKISIPRLAQGAVIPPNREFLAVLGDQKQGRNIEAPESLLRQMAQEAASANTSILREILAAIREGRVITIDRTILGKTSQSAIFDAQRMGY